MEPSMSSEQPEKVMTPANWLTLSRMLVAPLVLITFCYGGFVLRAVGFVLFGLGAISDFWDGYIARRTQLSYWGKLWDPIADKVLTGSALITLSVLQILPWWITVALILRDIAVTALRLTILRKGRGILLPILAAKLKTTFELIMLSSLLLWAVFSRTPLPEVAQMVVLVYAAFVVALSWATGIYYIKKGLKM